MNEDLTTFIIKELGRQRERKEIIQRVFEKGELAWREAERLVILLEARYQRTTAPRQSPLLLFLSIGMLLIGIGLMAYHMETVLALFRKDVLVQILLLRDDHYTLLELVSGLGMTAGGAAGLWKALGVIFPG